MNEIKYQIPSGDDKLAPIRGTEHAAGIDFKASEEVIIPAHSTAIIKTGVICEIPEGYVGLLAIRSSMAAKKRFMMANGVGIIDADFRGEIGVIIYNAAPEAQTIEKYQRIAQMVISPFYMATPVNSQNLSETARGEGGYGSTGQ